MIVCIVAIGANTTDVQSLNIVLLIIVYGIFSVLSLVLEANQMNLNEDRPILSPEKTVAQTL